MKSLVDCLLVRVGLLGLLWSSSANQVDDRNPAANSKQQPLGQSATASGKDKAAKSSIAQSLTIEGRLVNFRDAAIARTKVEWVDNYGADLLAIESNDGSLTMILPTETGRLFYNDRVHLGRNFRVEGVVRPLLAGLEVARVQRRKNGKLFETYYWCEVCAIKLYRHGDCTCCQGPVELRESQAKP